MKRCTPKYWNMGVAFVAAYMLVLQALIGAFALGTAAASPMLDAFGNPLCITSTDFTDSDSEQGNHSALPDCCTTACNMFAPVTADERNASSVANPLAIAAEKLDPDFEFFGRVLSPERNPGSPRSPPLTAA